MGAEELIKLAVGVLVLMAVITAFMFLRDTGNDLVVFVTGDIQETNRKLDEGDLTRYEGAMVSGADVINVIRGQSKSVEVVVKTWKDADTLDGDGTKYNNGIYSKHPGDDAYINPYAKFKCELGRSGNSTISTITFTQEAYVNSAKAWDNTESGGGTSGGTGTESTNTSKPVTTDDLNNAINGLKDAILGDGGSLSSQIADLRGAILGDVDSSLSSQIKKLSAAITTMQDPESEGSLAAQLGDIKDSNGTTSTSTELTDKINELTKDVTDIYIALYGGTKESKEYEGLIEKVENLQGSTDDTTEDSDTTEGSNTTTDLSAITNAITGISGTLDSISSTVNSLKNAIKGTAQGEYEDGLETKIGDIEETISNLKTTVDTINTTLDSINKTLEEAGLVDGDTTHNGDEGVDSSE